MQADHQRKFIMNSTNRQIIADSVGLLRSSHDLKLIMRECRGLKDSDILSKSDPICIVTTVTKEGRTVEVGRTEQIKDNLNPRYILMDSHHQLQNL